MKVVLKNDPSRIGEVVEFFITPTGQKRYKVRFLYSTVDADVQDFEFAKCK